VTLPGDPPINLVCELTVRRCLGQKYVLIWYVSRNAEDRECGVFQLHDPDSQTVGFVPSAVNVDIA
jgi:hypothetical protein